MTVAVANAKVLLVDTKVESGNTYYPASKYEVIVYKSDRYVIASAGGGREGARFGAHFRKHGLGLSPEPWEEGFEALIVGPQGVYHVDSGGEPSLQRRGWGAIGSGGDVAIGAIGLQLGEDKRAPTVAELWRGIQTACRYCECGGEIDEVWLNPKKRKSCLPDR